MTPNRCAAIIDRTALFGFAFDLSYASIELRKHISNQNDVEALRAYQILPNPD
jgi:hypothetical protein